MTAAWIALAVVVALALGVVVSYNRFVAQRAGVESSWSGVDVQLQRRHDLVPNLVETVRGYAAHERDVLEQVTRARAVAVAADRDPAVGPGEQARHEEALTGAAHGLLAVAEDYPDLRASTHFLQLQAQLTEAEDRIAAARRLYNIEVRGLNRRVEAFPSNLIASAFGITRAQYFETSDPSVAATPEVEI